MNIFVLDTNPVKAARYQCDKHVVKMILETAQILCTISDHPDTPYKPTHTNHPCVKWAEQSFENKEWLINHGLALAEEYTRRYQKIHKSSSVIEWVSGLFLKIDYEYDGLTPFVQCMPDVYKVENDPVTAYRNYYIGEKSKFARWDRLNNTPDWWLKSL